MTPRISVVIPTFRRPGLLARCLHAVLTQDLPPGEYEVIVVDDEPSPEVERLVRLHSGLAVAGVPAARRPADPAEARPTVRYLANAPNHGPAAARNAGWRAASAPLVAFTDDDCIPSPGWLRAGLEAMQPGVSAASGRLVVPLPKVPTDYERMTGRLAHALFVTANAFCLKADLEEVEGFDERFGTAWREDSDLRFKLLDAGKLLVRAEDAVVTHPVRTAPWGISLREQRKSLYNALLYRKHPRRYREEIQAAPPWRYYRAVGAIGLASAGVVTRRRRVALAGLAWWAAETSWFAAERLRGTSHSPAHVFEMAVTSALIPPLSIYWRLRGALRYRVPFL